MRIPSAHCRVDAARPRWANDASRSAKCSCAEREDPCLVISNDPSRLASATTDHQRFEHALATVERASAWYAIRYAWNFAIRSSHVSTMVSNLANLPYILPNSYVMPAIHE